MVMFHGQVAFTSCQANGGLSTVLLFPLVHVYNYSDLNEAKAILIPMNADGNDKNTLSENVSKAFYACTTC